ncbi:DUF4097 family beta strand repeat-containing protein [Allosalinactinospora lopnorensis]|uniref:DUF4097 family beta strand repeat-containing protein n=1 Tax=Allosalinactinospora lopnorensis TaxID=1352348 RepID=UPI000623CDF3|nr:DUF4097 family beta strand repeat-containing protein [Allosalinactinospora lopnorensis]
MTFSGRGLYASSSKEPRQRHFGWLVIGVCVAIAALVVGGLSAVGGVATSSESRGDTFDGAERLVVDNQTSGGTRITGTDGDTVTVERTLRGNPLHSVEEDVRLDGDSTVNAEARCTGMLIFGGFGGCSADYEIGVPEGTEITVETASGAVGVRAVEGGAPLSVSTKSGQVETTDVTADTSVRTSSGAIRLHGAEGDMDLESTSGAIQASGSGENIKATATSGSVGLNGISATDLTVETTSGAVRVDGGFGTADFAATSGSLDVNAAEPFQRITADTTSGAIDLRVPGGSYDVMGSSTSGSRDIAVDRDSGAEAEIDASTTSGSLSITPTG